MRPEYCGECGFRKPTHDVEVTGPLGIQRFTFCELCAHVVGQRLEMRARATRWAVRIRCCGSMGHGEKLRRIPRRVEPMFSTTETVAGTQLEPYSGTAGRVANEAHNDRW